MRKQFFLVGAVLALSSCSSPRYTYTFDHYDYNSGKKTRTEKSFVQLEPTKEVSPLTVSERGLLASASHVVVVSEKKISSTSSLKEKADRYKSLSKSERRDFIKEMKKEIKNRAKEFRSGDQGANVTATKELDDELKLAIIFGAIGITLTVLGGINTVFWVLGVIGLIIGLVFFIRWISRQ